MLSLILLFLIQNSIDVRDMPDWLQKEMDSTMTNCWLTGGEEAFTQLMYLIMSENVSGKLFSNKPVSHRPTKKDSFQNHCKGSLNGVPSE